MSAKTNNFVYNFFQTILNLPVYQLIFKIIKFCNDFLLNLTVKFNKKKYV